MLTGEITFLSIELLIYLSSISFFVFDVFETKLVLLFFFLSQTVLYILLMLGSIPLALFGSTKNSNRRR
jgi:hypothetical protein